MVRHRPRYCLNCGIRPRGGTELCIRCADLPRCRTCKRHLPHVHFSNSNGRCNACSRKVQKARHAGGSAIIEYDLQIEEADVLYEDFLMRNGDVIQRIVNEARREHRYVDSYFDMCVCVQILTCVLSLHVQSFCVLIVCETKIMLSHLACTADVCWSL
mgnify:CR=1 FL=1